MIARLGGLGHLQLHYVCVEGFSEALAKELKPLGIWVIIVEPGYFRTDFLDGSSLGAEDIDAWRTVSTSTDH